MPTDCVFIILTITITDYKYVTVTDSETVDSSIKQNEQRYQVLRQENGN